jgi:hypothetical protein
VATIVAFARIGIDVRSFSVPLAVAVSTLTTAPPDPVASACAVSLLSASRVMFWLDPSGPALASSMAPEPTSAVLSLVSETVGSDNPTATPA